MHASEEGLNRDFPVMHLWAAFFYFKFPDPAYSRDMGRSGLWGNCLEPIFFVVLGNLKFSIKLVKTQYGEISQISPQSEIIWGETFFPKTFDSPIVKRVIRRNKSNLFAMKSKVRILVLSSDQAAVICSYSRTSVAREE